MSKRPQRSKPKTDTQETQNSPFKKAIEFLATIAQDSGAPYQTHVRLGSQLGMTYNGLVALGCNINDDLTGIPHTLRLLDALKKCHGQYSLAQLDEGRISIKSEKFRAIVQCINDFPLIVPDAPIASIDDRLKTAIGIVAPLASETAELPHLASILINGGCAVGTDGAMVIQAWHGIDLPPGLLLPKATATALNKIKKPLAKFGYSSTSVTFYFEDDSWLRSQLWIDEWPKLDHILNAKANYWPMPESFYTALDAIADFSEDGIARFHKGVLCSHNSPEIGASYEIHGLPSGSMFNIKRLKLIQPYAKRVDFNVNGEARLMFACDNVRGVCMGVAQK